MDYRKYKKLSLSVFSILEISCFSISGNRIECLTSHTRTLKAFMHCLDPKKASLEWRRVFRNAAISKQKKGAFLRRILRANKARSQNAHPHVSSLSARLCCWERLQYFKTAQTRAQTEIRLSLAMDATSVSFD